MDIRAVIDELRARRDRLDEAIRILEEEFGPGRKKAPGAAARRGRPRKKAEAPKGD